MGAREQHVRALAAQHGLRVVLSREPDSYTQSVGLGPWKGSAFYDHIRILGWDGSSTAYLIALHEIAHHALGHWEHGQVSDQWYRSRRAEAEAEAWEWALDHAEFARVGPSLKQRVGTWLATYARSYPYTKGMVFRRVAPELGLAA